MKHKNFTRKILIPVFLFFLLLSSSAFSETKKWTIMVYLAADNNLEKSAIDDFLEMSNVGSDDNINILVQLDRINGYDSRYDNWTICHRFYVTSNMEPTESNSVPDWGDGKGGREVNMGSKKTLTDFVRWGVEKYPAEKYAIILWNHGSGWKSLQEEKPIFVYKEICWDDTSGDKLSTKEVREALENVGEDIHLIGFDACLMGMLEVATEIKSLGEVMVASEEIEPISGWDFEGFLTALKQNPNMSAHQLGTAIVDTYINHGEVGNNGETLSAIDLTKISDFNSKLDTLLEKIISLNTEWLNVYISRQSTQIFDTRIFLDIKDFLENLSANSYNQEIISLTQETINSFEDLIIKNYSANGYNANGLSIYFPAHSGTIDKDYRSEVILFASETSWKSFLQSFIFADIFSGYMRIYKENFTSGLPLNWSVVDGYQDGKTWELKSSNSYSSYLTLPYMVVDSDASGDVDMDEQLISEFYDFDKYSVVYLSFNHYFRKYTSEKADVD